MENKIDISVVIPLLDEKDSLPELYQKLRAVLDSLDSSYELIFVDDGSRDGSFDVLKELREADPRVKVIQFRKNYGKSAALSVGFKAASGDIIFTIDADLQDDPQEIPNLLRKLEQGYDLVSGWKRKRRDPLIKRLSSRLFNRVTSMLTGIKIHDLNCGLKVYRREVIQAIKLYGQLHRFLPVLAHWDGFRVGEVVVRHHPRKYGRTKFGLSRYSAGFFDLITVMFLTRYNRRPLHLFGIAGLVSFLAGFGISLYLTIQRLTAARYLSNRPLLFLGVLLIIVGVQFVSIGLLGEMITRSSRDLEEYSIKTTLGLDE